MCLGRELPTARSFVGLILIAVGAVMYAHADEEFNNQGASVYLWPFLYLLMISFEMLYGKKIVRSVKFLTLSGKLFARFNNNVVWRCNHLSSLSSMQHQLNRLFGLVLITVSLSPVGT